VHDHCSCHIALLSVGLVRARGDIRRIRLRPINWDMHIAEAETALESQVSSLRNQHTGYEYLRAASCDYLGCKYELGPPRKYELEPAEAAALTADGLSLSEIGRRLGGGTPIHPTVIRRLLAADKSLRRGPPIPVVSSASAAVAGV
jgi:hypothetical protein